MLVDLPDDSVVLPAESASADQRLELYPDDVAVEFETMEREDLDQTPDPRFPFRLVVRRMKETYNSSGRRISALHPLHTNPLCMHPADIERLAITSGSRVTIRSNDGEIGAQVVADATMREGVVAMTHCWGGLPEDDHDRPGVGENTGRLVSRVAPIESIGNMPRLTGIPVEISARSNKSLA
jgi:anaerobic selenocysteine-containing dehydrogenase